jgi:hypothetical protein
MGFRPHLHHPALIIIAIRGFLQSHAQHSSVVVSIVAKELL